jgi:DNA-binding transcriptional ArsR family regulator
MEANIATPAALIGDPVRAAILLALLDDRIMPATALARQAGVSPQAASNHLTKLVAGGLLSVTARGRCRYYRVARPEVAHALEALAVLGPAPRELAQPHSLKARRLREARCCYDHLAGRLGVALADALEFGGLIEAVGPERYDLTPAGCRRLEALGVDLKRLRSGSKSDARRCIDWTERRRHLAGPLATRLLCRFLDLAWIERGKEHRAIKITAAGHEGLRAFGVELEPGTARSSHPFSASADTVSAEKHAGHATSATP